MRFSQDEVFYTLEVGRYVENTVSVPVTITDAPSYANVAVIPQEVTLRYRQPFGSGIRFAAQDFAVGIYYNDVLQNDVVKLQLIKAPQQVMNVTIEPKFVERIL